MTRKHPSARRAVALALLASFLFAANVSALFHPDPAQAECSSTSPGRRPMPGDPNIPDESGRTTTVTSTITQPRAQGWIVYWLKDVVHFVFRAR